ncbi:MAG: right-handed parallel beta-helix repeat-containing protein [Ruminococcus sp.]|nr:right-handed parallel beta-helix repeat-containing protein [Ruminococcus sp.]
MKAGRIIAFLTAAAVVPVIPLTVSAGTAGPAKRIIGYLPEWHYKPYADLDYSALTHINIAFFEPDSSGELQCDIPDSEMKKIVEKAHTNGVEVYAALGGADNSSGFYDFIDTPGEMASFDEGIMTLCGKFDFDGIDLDIEVGSSDRIWNVYGDWCSDLRERCDKIDIGMSTATAHWVAEKVSPETFALFDHVNVMAYDNDEDRYSHSSYEYAEVCLDYFLNTKKIPKDRLVLGVPFYGRGYDSSGALDWNKVMTFSEIVAESPENYALDSYKGIAYNGAETIKKKAELGRDYGGIMIWELTHDAKGDMSLLKVISDTIGKAGDTIVGDVNSDGVFDISDAKDLQGWLLGDGTLLKDWQAGDFTGDGIIDTFDFVLMKKALAETPQEDNSIVVSDIEGIFTAVRNAKPGDVIKIAPGTYDYTPYYGAQKIDTEAEGTENAPITLTALDPDDPPVLTGNTTEHGYVLHIKGDWWILDNLVCTNSQKGIVLDHSDHTVIRSCEIYKTGAEAIALRDGSSWCTVDSCNIHDTGLVSPGYGEGVYVGSAKNHTEFDHKSDHNRIIGCVFKNIAAEDIDIKEYTTDTEVGFCTFYGDGMTGENYAGSFVDTAGNDCYIHDNTGYRNGNPKIVAAFEIHDQVDGWGYHHVFENNTVYMDQPYGAENTSRPMYVVDGWFSDFTVKNNKVDYGEGLVDADKPEFYNSDQVTFG